MSMMMAMIAVVLIVVNNAENKSDWGITNN